MFTIDGLYRRLSKTKSYLMYGDPCAYQDLHFLYFDVIKKLNDVNLHVDEEFDSNQIYALKQLENELEDLIDEYHYLST